MGKYSLIVVGGFVFVFGYVSANLNRANERFVDQYVEYYERGAAKLTANSLANMSLAMLADSSSWRAGYSNIGVAGGYGTSTIVDDASDTTLSAGQVRITADGSNGQEIDTVQVVVQLASAGIPPGVHGGVTANSTVKTLGA